MAMLDAGIILQGRSPNVLGSMGAGMQLRQQRDEMDRANVLAEFMQQNGAGVMRGEANALAGFAAIDPMAAIDVQGSLLGQQATSLGMDATRQGMAENTERLGMDRDRVQREVEEMARGLAADERIALADRQEDIMRGATFAYEQGPEALASYLSANGIDPASIPYDRFLAEAAEADVASEYLRAAMPEPFDPMAALDLERAQLEVDALRNPGPGDAYEQFRPVGGEVWDYGPEGAGAVPALLPGQGDGMVVYGPDGQPIMAQGSGGNAPRPFTEGQSKDVGFATRARGALDTLNQIGAEPLANRGDQVLGAIPLGLGRSYQGDDYQLAEQAGRELLVALLRKDTGAAVTPQEDATYGDLYLPRPGDSPARMDAKAEARERAVAGLEQGMTVAQMAAQARALLQAADDAPVGGSSVDSSPTVVPGGEQPAVATIPPATILAMPRVDFDAYVGAMTPEQLDALPDDVFEAVRDRARQRDL